MFIFEYLRKEKVEAFLELDQRVYPIEYQSSKRDTLSRLEKNPMTDIVVHNQKKMVGYISLIPIPSPILQKINLRQIEENEIESHVIPYKKIGYYDAYLSSIVVDKISYPTFKGFYLFHHLQTHIKKLKKRGFFIRNIIAIAVSKAGHHLLNKLKFGKVDNDIFILNCRNCNFKLLQIPTIHPFLVKPHSFPLSLLKKDKNPNLFSSTFCLEWDRDT